MFSALLSGSKRAARSLKLLLSLFAFNLLFALPLIIPIFATIQLSTVNRLTARNLMADQIDPIWFTDLVNNQLTNGSLIGFATETFIQFVIIAGLYLLFNLLLSGGILSYYIGDTHRFSMRKFWSAGGAFFWRFVRLMFYAAPCYIAVLIAYSLTNRFINARIGTLSALGNYPWYKLALVLALMMALAWVNMVFDYARIHTVMHNERGMWRSTLMGWKFGLRRIFTAYPLYLSLAGFGFVVMVFLTWLRETVIQDGLFAVGLATAFGHVAIIFKLWAKLALAASQVNYYRALQPVPVEASTITTIDYEFRSATSEMLDEAVLAKAEAAYAEKLAAVVAPTTNPLQMPAAVSSAGDSQ